jgi:hypothetical protein
VLFSPAAFSEGAKDTSAARSAAERWIKLIDAEEFSNAWNSGSASMQAGMPKFAWTTVASGIHAVQGKVKARKLKSAVPSSDGSAIAFEYESQFENAAKVSETVNTVYDKDKTWRVSGYTVTSK